MTIAMRTLLNAFQKCKVTIPVTKLVHFLPVQDDRDDEGDANVIDQVTSNICPLTQKAFVEPVQSKKCKHKYEKKPVLKYIADKNKARRPAKCPSAGCNTILDEKDLINA